jgi:hypothetical protein
MTYTPKSYSHYTVLCRLLGKPIKDNWTDFVLSESEAKELEDKGLLSMLCKGSKKWIELEEFKALKKLKQLPII